MGIWKNTYNNGFTLKFSSLFATIKNASSLSKTDTLRRELKSIA